MRGCLVPAETLDRDRGSVEGGAAHHLRDVLRVRAGDALTLCDGRGRTRAARVAATARGVVEFESAGPVATVPPPRPAVTLFQCIAKSARMDWLVEKAGELGVATLVPVRSARCVGDYPEGEVVGRWRRQAESALEQCGSAWVTEIAPVARWKRAAEAMAVHPLVLVAALSPEARPLRETLLGLESARGGAPSEVAVAIGPEGDFSPEELRGMLDAGAVPVSLGDRVLRTETAALALVSAVRMMWG